MASQSEAPDDLIAELARLMADEGKPESKPQAQVDQLGGLRLPGDAAAAPVAPVQPDTRPQFDFSSLQAARPAAPAPVAAAPAAPSIRIPGSDAPPVAVEPKPFSFDFDSTISRKPVGPASSLETRVQPTFAEPAPKAPEPAAFQTRPPEPVVAKPAPAAEPVVDEAAALDQDSLADLIAAELANDFLPPEPDAPSAPEPAAPPPPRSEDNFGVPPVFGLGTKPVAAAPETEPKAVVEPTRIEPNFVPQAEAAPVAPHPQAMQPDAGAEELDPLSDIEKLVGPSVNLGEGEQPAAMRSRATPVLPDPALAPQPPVRRGERRKHRDNLDSVDEAIMAAAAATGAQVDWVSDETSRADPAAGARAMRGAPTPLFGLTRAVAGPLVAVVLLIAAGGGLYWVLGQGNAPTGPAPLIAADTSAVKETPAPVESEQSQSVVFNEISGVDTGAQEQIVSRDQTAQEPVSQIASAGSLSSDPATGVTDPNQDGLVNRKVRTVTVRPDGTIVAGDDSVAGATMLPVDRPNVPDVPGADFSTPDLIASAEATGAEATATAPATPVTPVVEAGAVVPVGDASGALITGRTVTIPRQKPGNFQQIAAAAQAMRAAQPAAATPDANAAATPATTAPAPTAAPSAGNAAAYVQLSSQRTEEAARTTAQQIATRYGVLFGGANLEIQRVDLGERGIYYRVLVPADSRASATNICTNVKAAGGDCFLL